MHKEQRGLILMFFNLIIAVLTFNLMVHNMTGKSFSVFQPIVLLAVVPFVTHFYLDLPKEVDYRLPQVLTALILVIFVIKMSILAKQWCDYSKRPFWYIPSAHFKKDD